MMRKLMRMGGLLAAAVVLLYHVSAAEWQTSYDAALKMAAAQDKLVLADFTGSDWCYYCIRLRKDVLDEPGFSAWAQTHFVLLEIDMPENPDFDATLRRQNEQLCRKYGVNAYPTLLVLNANGEPLGGLYGYEPTPAAVQKELEAGVRAGTLLAQARRSTGEQKLKLMLDAWKLIPDDARKLCPNLAAALRAIDEQDLSGLRAEAEAERMLEQCRRKADAAPTDAAALPIVEDALAHACPQNKRQLLELKYRLLILCAETEADVLAAAEVAYAIIDADLRLSPEEKASRKRQMQGVFANPRTTLNRSRMKLRKRPSR